MSNHVARLDGTVTERFRKVERGLRDYVIGALLAQLEVAVGTDKTLDFIDDAETYAAREEAAKTA